MTISFTAPFAQLASGRIGRTSDALARSYERLSSGLRINSASDDPAGLMLATQLGSSSRVLDQGIRNLNDGISLLNVAQGALDDLMQITTRLQELSSQASNGAYSSTQRNALDKEADALVAEANRIIRTADFNGRPLFGASRQTVSIHTGSAAPSTIDLSIGLQFDEVTATGTFSPKSSFTTGALGTIFLESGDFDGDGDLDLVTANNESNDISIMLNDGNGSFTLSQKVAVGTTPQIVVTGDFNGDGKLDLATANEYSNNVSILRGDGSGGFVASQTVSVGAHPTGLAVADLDGDGDSDLAVTNSWGASLNVLENNGSGTFSVSASVATGNGPLAVVAADFDGDGDLDLATANWTAGNVSILLQGSSGNFTSGGTVAVGTNPAQIVAGDFNNDGKVDLATANEGSNSLSVLIGSGAGSFSAATTLATGAAPWGVEAKDFNGDGNIDLVSADETSSTLSVFLGNGTGSFGARTAYATGGGPETVIARDFNGDGIYDLASADYYGGTVSVLLGGSKVTTSSTFDDVDLTTVSSARKAMAAVNGMAEQIQQEIGSIGAAQSRLAAAYSVTAAMRDALEEAQSRVTSVDIAAEAANLVRLQILQQAQTAVAAQSKLHSEMVLKLLGSGDVKRAG